MVCPLKHHHFAISILILVISTSSHLRLFNVEGIKIQSHVPDSSKTAVNEENKTTWRAQIGSKPPRCERRCSTCEHCEAIQVPTSPKTESGSQNSSSLSTITSHYDNSNYKPMSWKCKCGNLIFNP
ncbi:hypothetical protein CDL12_02654 [Handroanthus impetiginosus]|uniref:Epidermal patterning factor-like protein n=1 Tax=Handroanthus impetiginosus TaxID=429701 RepID=A0A2G9I4D7_9LAMI|nr:hypothetical protein CDL12_02654 [Handroanthus impetiginosus]